MSVADFDDEQAPETPNRERVRLWVEDLRSGDHPQMTSILAGRCGYPSDESDEYDATIGYCCLGRACEVAIANGVQVVKTSSKSESVIRYNDSSMSMPTAVREWYGFHSSDPIISPVGAQPVAASNANDVLRMSFDRIADWIEQRYLTDGDSGDE